jgi:TP901 family phage tail tape measure protein
MARDVTININGRNLASNVFKKVSQDAARMSKNIAGSMQSMGASATRMGRNLTLAGGAGVAAFAGMTRTFAKFDDMMATVSAITGSTGDDLDALRDKAKELGSSTKFSASEAAEGMKFLGMAGFDTQQILAGIGPTLSLAAAGGVELGAAADIASDVGSAFGLTADEIGRVADVIATTATSANTDVMMMGETFAQMAPVAKAAGQSLEEVSAAAGLLGNSGVKASVAGTDLKNILAQLATGPVQEKLKALKVSVRDANDEFRPMMDVLKDLNEKTSQMKGPDRLAKMIELFGKRSAKSALIIGGAGDQIDIMRDKMFDAEGAAAKMAETMQTGLGGAGTRLMSAFEGLQISIIEGLKVPLEKAAAAITSFLSKATEFFNANPQFVKAIAAVTIAIGGIGVALMAAGTAFGVAGAAVAAFGAIASAVGTAVQIIWSPITLVVLGVAAAAAAAAAYFTALGVTFAYVAHQTGLLGDAWEQAKLVLASLWEIVQKTFAGISNALSSGDWALAAKIAWAGVKLAFWDGLIGIGNAFASVLPQLWNTITDFLWKWVEEAGKAALLVAKILASPTSAGELIGEAIGEGLFSKLSGKGLTDILYDQRQAAEQELDKLTAIAADSAKVMEDIAKPAVESPTSKIPKPKPEDFIPPDLKVPEVKIEEIEVPKINVDEMEVPDVTAGIVDTQGFNAEETTGAGLQVQQLTGVSGRLLTRGPSADPALQEAKKQTKILADVAKNTEPIKESVGKMPEPAMSVEMIA